MFGCPWFLGELLVVSGCTLNWEFLRDKGGRGGKEISEFLEVRVVYLDSI